MFKFLLAAHLVLAVFAVGPLVHAATTAGRGLRRGDGAATASASRVLRIYAYASVLVIIAGFGLMAQKAPWNPKEKVAEFGDTWIWLSLLLWALAVGIVLGVVVPTLDRATKQLEGVAPATGSAPAPVAALTGRVAAGGGVVALIFLAIVFLMVYQPGG